MLLNTTEKSAKHCLNYEDIDMKTDRQVREDVEAALDWDPSFDSRKIGVAVQHGVVTLSGHVSAFPDRWAAQKTTLRVGGVKAVANEIEINLPLDAKRSDTDIASAALTALKSNISIPMDSVQLTVHDGWITLTGKVNWWYQKNAAEMAVHYLHGVRGVSNNLTIHSPPIASTSEVRSKIESAFQRQAHLYAQKIKVAVSGHTVTLEGEVPTWQERWEAETAAWSAPGVSKVEDHLVIRA